MLFWLSNSQFLAEIFHQQQRLYFSTYRPTRKSLFFNYHNPFIKSTLDYFSLYIDDAGYLRPDMMGKTGYFTLTSVLSTTWTLITVSYMLRMRNDNSVVISQDGNKISHQNIYPTTVITFATTDFVRIGGPPAFRGSIGNFQIFNPGSALVTQPGIYLFFCLLKIIFVKIMFTIFPLYHGYWTP